MGEDGPKDGFQSQFQLVIEPQNRRSDFQLGNLRNGAVCLVTIMTAADPVCFPTRDLLAAERATFPTVNALTIEGFPSLSDSPSKLPISEGHQLLYTLEILATYNGRVTVLHKITRLLAAVSNLLEWYRICGIALCQIIFPVYEMFVRM